MCFLEKACSLHVAVFQDLSNYSDFGICCWKTGFVFAQSGVRTHAPYGNRT